ncbi:pilus assembly protein TadG-related protein [Actinacidiphila sp. ITFR-21]|uniref:pilus assembly protein TadG-related protein n=1 Tax=Actinacidiphila sp. ITFR-21 TaxID=3075199 RepID=UPI0028892AB5|nr:pilus assembly protein TadG-related protein [Streptomyces sp. ITFR-21]WNI15964.1 hypothetical protein RLT57_10825 [Streptomyces sp. ITFR-21]
MTNPRITPTLRTVLADRLQATRHGDRGSGTAAVLIFALLFMSLAAFVVDGGLSISKRERAADIAEQAARYAAEDIDVEALRAADGATAAVIKTADCTTDVQTFAARSGLDREDIDHSGCTLAEPDRVEVSIQLTYRPILTGFFYDKPVIVRGTAAAESITGAAN